MSPLTYNSGVLGRKPEDLHRPGGGVMNAMKTRRIRVLGLVCFTTTVVGAVVGAAADSRLVDAAARQDTEAVRALIDEGVDVNTRHADGATALLWTTHWDDHEAVRMLLDHGADPNAADDHGVTPLIRATENASVKMVETLLVARADASAAQANGLTPLMVAAHTGSVEVVQALLAHGADVNAATAETEATALMWAVAVPHRDIVRELLESGADVSPSSTKGMTPLLTAAANGDIESAKLLMADGAGVNDVGSDGTHVLPFAIVNGQDDFALFLLDEGADPNGMIDGIPALHAAAGRVDAWLVHWDRRHGAARFIGSRSTAGRQRLDAARRLSLVTALLASGADPDGRITTTSMLMNYIGHPKKGAFEPFACGTGDLRGATPLWVAAFGAATDGAYRGGAVSEFVRAAQSGAEIIRVLLDADADQHLTTDDGTTPFMAAAGLGRSTFRPNQTRGTRSPGAEEAVKVLLEAGADINATNEADFTALHGAAFRGLNEVVEYLVAHDADIDARDFRGRTPFRLAEGSKQSFQFQAFPETAELLQQLGADTRLGIPGTVQERADRDVAANVQP